ncbi:hypothetical protein E2C01_007915 [Portunus trituberculatus]|uniref:Uncharacterized protein n=1 Tax=Portunus trituberculatus TaxID=210409 RepID=A0A5B7D087_PORTR|nr:hypothetical protein [Portunus trituberculatus]
MVKNFVEILSAITLIILSWQVLIPVFHGRCGVALERLRSKYHIVNSRTASLGLQGGHLRLPVRAWFTLLPRCPLPPTEVLVLRQKEITRQISGTVFFRNCYLHFGASPRVAARPSSAALRQIASPATQAPSVGIRLDSQIQPVTHRPRQYRRAERPRTGEDKVSYSGHLYFASSLSSPILPHMRHNAVQRITECATQNIRSPIHVSYAFALPCLALPPCRSVLDTALHLLLGD